MSRVGLVGFGRVATRVATHLGPNAKVVAILAHRSIVSPDDVLVTADLGQFLAAGIDIVLEAASTEACRLYAADVVAAGIDLVPLSLCAFLDEGFAAALRAAAERPGAGRILLAPGATIGAVEALAAARASGLDRVVYRTAKPVSVWRQTAAAELVDLDTIASETIIARGTVRELAGRFPHNLNVAVGVALAGLGPDRTEMELFADPNLSVTIHEVEFWGRPGHVKLRLVGTDPDPLTDVADYTAFSVLNALRTRTAPVLL